MEDKKVMEFIQKQHEELIEQDRINRKKKHKINFIKDIIFYTFLVVAIIFLIRYIAIDNKKSMAKCLNNGYDYNYCLKNSY